jgi:hypothetical protein
MEIDQLHRTRALDKVTALRVGKEQEMCSRKHSWSMSLDIFILEKYGAVIKDF